MPNPARAQPSPRWPQNSPRRADCRLWVLDTDTRNREQIDAFLLDRALFLNLMARSGIEISSIRCCRALCARCCENLVIILRLLQIVKLVARELRKTRSHGSLALAYCNFWRISPDAVLLMDDIPFLSCMSKLYGRHDLLRAASCAKLWV